MGTYMKEKPIQNVSNPLPLQSPLSIPQESAQTGYTARSTMLSEPILNNARNASAAEKKTEELKAVFSPIEQWLEKNQIHRYSKRIYKYV